MIAPAIAFAMSLRSLMTVVLLVALLLLRPSDQLH